ncbi:hypothetical protein JCM10213_002592 [Rhodosporidiobolus nylandii]
MSVPSFAGAPVSRALITTLAVASTLAAVTSTQPYFNLPLVPHLSRDHQFWRFLVAPFVFSNSSELFLAVLVLWYASPGVERMFGTRKFASFLVVITAATTVLTALLLSLGWQATRGRFNSLPSGPFAVTFAIVYQSHRLVPTLYHFRLFHPILSLTNRFPLYVLSLLLFTAQPPSSMLLSTLGLLASPAWSANFLSLRSFRLPPRFYSALARAGKSIFGDPARMKVKRGNAVTMEEAMLQTLLGASGGVGGGVASAGGFDVSALRGAAPRRPSTATAATAAAAPAAPAAPTAAPAADAAEANEGVAAALPIPTQPAAPPAEQVPPLLQVPRIPGASFLRQWQAGLTGAAEGPSPEQIAELQAIFPHHTRQAVVAALQANGHSVARAAEALVLSEQ